MLDEGEQSVDSNKPSKFDPIVTVDYEKGKTYCYKYFRPYKYDWRLLLTNDNGKPIECTCSRARIHDKKCVWYNPNFINIPDTRNDLSISEQAAQGKIYNMYQTPKMANKNHVDVVQQLRYHIWVTSQPVKSSNGYMREVPMRCC